MTETGPDHVGRILAQWAVERPDLDVSPMGIPWPMWGLLHIQA